MGKIVRESGDLFETLVAPNHSWSTAATSHPDNNNTFNSMSGNGWDRQLNNQFDSVWSSLGEGNSSGGHTNSGSSQTNSGFSNTNAGGGSNGSGWNSQLNSQFDSIWSFGDQQQQSNANQGQAAAANTSGGGSGQNSRTAANNGGNADNLWRGQMTVAGGGDRAWRA